MGKSTLKANRTLLWTNPDTSVAFAPQTITLDLSKYSLIEIDCLASTGTIDTKVEYCPVGEDAMATYISGGNGYGLSTPFISQRRFRTTTSGVQVLQGLGAFTGANSYGYNSDTRMIPHKIYGIK